MKRLRNVVGLLLLAAACELPNQGLGTLDLRATAGPGRITLSWDPVPADSYRIESSTSADFSAETSVVDAAVSPVAVDVLPGQTYYFRASAIRSGNPSVSATAEYTAEGWSWNAEAAFLQTVSQTDTEVYPIEGTDDMVIFFNTYKIHLHELGSLRYDADGLTLARWIRQTSMKDASHPAITYSDAVEKRGQWAASWETFILTEKKVGGVWVELVPQEAYALSTEDRNTFTLDGEEATWTAIP